jgi:hypothetical protein
MEGSAQCSHCSNNQFLILVKTYLYLVLYCEISFVEILIKKILFAQYLEPGMFENEFSFCKAIVCFTTFLLYLYFLNPHSFTALEISTFSYKYIL